MPPGLGPFWDQSVTLLLLIAAALGGIHIYKKNASAPKSAQKQTMQTFAPSRTESSAEEIQKQRYVRGEINRTQYLDMLEMLRAQSPDADRSLGSSQAVEIVRQRYARGEIDRQHFQQIMGDLKTVARGRPEP